MKKGDMVVIKHSNPLYSEKCNEWQVWRVMDLRVQATGVITKLKGLCVKGTYVTGLSPNELEVIHER